MVFVLGSTDFMGITDGFMELLMTILADFGSISTFGLLEKSTLEIILSFPCGKY